MCLHFAAIGVGVFAMNKTLKSLYRLKDRLTRDFEAATRTMPEKQALDLLSRLITILEKQHPDSLVDSGKVIRFQTKPRTRVSDTERHAILEWAERYYRSNENRPITFRRLTDLMLADGVAIPGSPQTQVFVVTGLITRNKIFTGQHGLWHLAEFAASAA